MLTDPVIQQRIFVRSRSLARDTSKIVELLDKYRSSKDATHLREAATVACRSLEDLRDPQLPDVLEALCQAGQASLGEAKRRLKDRAVLEEFLEAEYSLLRLIGASEVASKIVIEECRRLHLRAFRSAPNAKQLLQALDLLEREVCGGEKRLQSDAAQRRVTRKYGGWMLVFANGALAAASALGAPLSLGLTLSIGAGTAGSLVYGEYLVTK